MNTGIKNAFIYLFCLFTLEYFILVLFILEYFRIYNIFNAKVWKDDWMSVTQLRQ